MIIALFYWMVHTDKTEHKRELAHNVVQYSDAMHIEPQTSQEKALVELILMIHTRIKCVIQATARRHDGFIAMRLCF